MKVKATLQINGQVMCGIAIFKEGDAFVRFISDDGIFSAAVRAEFCSMEMVDSA